MSATQRLPDGSQLLVFMPYTLSEKHGVTVLVVISFISLLTVLGLLTVLAISFLTSRTSLEKHIFVRTHVAAYFASLLLCDLVQAIGSIANIRWISTMGVSLGPLCALQGALKQTADIGIAIWQLVIAVHTFSLLFLELKVRQFVLWVTMFAGWSAIATLVIFGPATADESKHGPFYAITGDWCLISPLYKIERITLDYLIMFLAAFFSSVLYALIFLRLRGIICRQGWLIRFRRSSEQDATEGAKNMQADALARQMVLYPVAYTIIILPTACAQFATWAGRSVPASVTVFCSAIFHLSGVLNATIFIIALRALPAETMKVGRWTITRGGKFNHTEEALEAGKQDETSVQHSPTSHSSNTSVNTTSTTSKRTKARPPDIIITRDSFESMYSVNDGDIPVAGGPQPPAAIPHWSPDGTRQRR